MKPKSIERFLTKKCGHCNKVMRDECDPAGKHNPCKVCGKSDWQTVLFKEVPRIEQDLQKPISFFDVDYFQVGCRKCGEGDGMQLFADGESGFIVRCVCGHIIDLARAEKVSKPDEKPMGMRFFI